MFGIFFDLWAPILSLSIYSVAGWAEKGFVRVQKGSWWALRGIDKKIIDTAPVPELEILKQKRLDQEVLDLMPERARKPILATDLGYQSIGRRIKFTLGPLGKLWGPSQTPVGVETRSWT